MQKEEGKDEAEKEAQDHQCWSQGCEVDLGFAHAELPHVCKRVSRAWGHLSLLSSVFCSADWSVNASDHIDDALASEPQEFANDAFT